MTTGGAGRSAANPFDRRAAVYGQGNSAYFWEFGRLLADEVAVAPGARVLDVAAGTGAVALPLARAGARVLALDVSAPMLARMPDGGDRPVARVLASAQAIPLPAAAVDAVTCGFGVAFFPDLAGALAEMRRVLRPDGQLALSWWRFDLPTPWVEALRVGSALDPDGGRRQRAMEELSDATGLARRVRDAGFGSTRVRPFELEWTEESIAAFADNRAAFWERDRGGPMPTAVRKRLEALTAGWTAPDGRVQYPLRAFAVLAGGAAPQS